MAAAVVAGVPAMDRRVKREAKALCAEVRNGLARAAGLSSADAATKPAMRLPQTGVALKPQVPQPASR